MCEALGGGSEVTVGVSFQEVSRTYTPQKLRVTPARFIRGNTTFALSGITSVRLETIPGSSGASGVMIFVGVAGVSLMIIADESRGAVFSALVIALGLFMRGRAIPPYQVMFSAAGSEISGLETADRNFATRVLSAINDAIVDRG
jgi:hypothetical protein